VRSGATKRCTRRTTQALAQRDEPCKATRVRETGTIKKQHNVGSTGRARPRRASVLGWAAGGTGASRSVDQRGSDTADAYGRHGRGDVRARVWCR